MNLWKKLFGSVSRKTSDTESHIEILGDHKVGQKGLCIICGCTATAIRQFGWNCKNSQSKIPSVPTKSDISKPRSENSHKIVDGFCVRCKLHDSVTRHNPHCVLSTTPTVSHSAPLNGLPGDVHASPPTSSIVITPANSMTSSSDDAPVCDAAKSEQSKKVFPSKRDEKVTPSALDLYLSDLSGFSADEFMNLLNNLTPGFKAEFVSDQNLAIAWYKTTPHPCVTAEDKSGVDWFLGMAETANSNASWMESWALAHHGLIGTMNLDFGASAAKACWLLGVAQTGKKMYKTASNYLQIAGALALSYQHDEIFYCAMYDRTVTACLAKPDSLDVVCKTLLEFLESSRKNNKAGEPEAARWLFDRADQLTRYGQEGKTRSDCATYATGYYAVSIYINRILNNKPALAISLANLGAQWLDLGNKARAKSCWIEAVSICDSLGDSQTKSVVEKWLLKL